jgi:taurine transport system permease protein
VTQETPKPGKPKAASVAGPAAVASLAPPRPPPWWRTLRADPPVQIRLVIGAALIAFIVLVWWLVTRGDAISALVSPSKLPSPGAVLSSFGSLKGNLTEGIIATLERVFLGVLLAAVFGVVLGVLAGTNRVIGAAVAPIVIFLRSIPMGALLPLMLMLFATGEKQKVMFIFFAIVPFVFSDTVKAVSIVPDRYIETAQTLGASRLQIVYKVLVPLSLPDIITSLRFQLGLGLGYIMLAEDIDTEFGLGKLISLSQRQGLNDQVYMTLFVIASIAFMIDYFLRTVQRGAFSWRKDL